MLVEYLFVYSEKNHSFPVRLRVIGVGEGPEIPDADQLTGSVEKADVTSLMDRLRQEYPSPEFRVAKSYANTWHAVARNYAGMDHDHFSSDRPRKAEIASPANGSQETAPAVPNPSEFASSRAAEPSPVQTPPTPRPPVQSLDPIPQNEDSGGTHPVGAILMETTGSRGTHVYNFAGVVLFLGAVAAAWPEFSQRYGGLVSWYWTIRHNPSWGIYGIMVPLCIAAGAYALYWFVYYWRVKVIVHQYGIRFLPNERFVNWNDVEHVRYAYRTMRYTGTPRQALRLEVFRQKPVSLPHKFDGMERLVSLVRKHVEPVVLQKCKDRIGEFGSVSFGKQITISSDHLALNNLGVPVLLNQIERVVVTMGTFQITNEGGQVIFSKAVESIPDAIVISDLVTELKQSAAHQST